MRPPERSVGVPPIALLRSESRIAVYGMVPRRSCEVQAGGVLSENVSETESSMAQHTKETVDYAAVLRKGPIGSAKLAAFLLEDHCRAWAF